MYLSPTSTAQRDAGRNNAERLNKLIKMFVVPGLILAGMVLFAFVPSMLKALSNFVQMDSLTSSRLKQFNVPPPAFLL